MKNILKQIQGLGVKIFWVTGHHYGSKLLDRHQTKLVEQAEIQRDEQLTTILENSFLTRREDKQK